MHETVATSQCLAAGSHSQIEDVRENLMRETRLSVVHSCRGRAGGRLLQFLRTLVSCSCNALSLRHRLHRLVDRRAAALCNSTEGRLHHRAELSSVIRTVHTASDEESLKKASVKR